MKNLSFTKYVLRSLAYYRKSALLVILGAMVASTVISGALLLGDSVRENLRSLAFRRIGGIQWAFTSQGRFFSSKLADRLGEGIRSETVPIISLSGTAGSRGGNLRINNASIYGVDERFLRQFPEEVLEAIPPGEAVINRKAAEMLGLAKGDEFTISVARVGDMPSDMPFSARDDRAGLRLKVFGISMDRGAGDFSLRTDPRSVPGILVSLPYLAERIGAEGRINTILIPEGQVLSGDKLNEAFGGAWRIEDAGYSIVDIPGTEISELRSKGVFLAENIETSVEEILPGAELVFSYFVNSIIKGERATPYSIVSSRDSRDAEIEEGRIIINSWLADDIGAAAGDTVKMEYYVIGADRTLRSEERSFVVDSVEPVDESEAARFLMPDIPGLSDEGNCRDWDPGILIDLSRIRDKDEKYWDDHRGTPKAYINLSEARKIWSNSFGTLTGIRFNSKDKGRLADGLSGVAGPETLGYYFRDIREINLRSAEGSVDFSQLFLALSFFVVISALILTGLFFSFYTESRIPEIETLRALGYKKKQIYGIFLAEGGFIAIAGSVLGIPVSLVYVKLFLKALGSVWQGALRADIAGMHVSGATLAAGCIAGFIFALAAMGLRLRSFMKAKDNILPPPGGLSVLNKLVIGALPVLIAVLTTYAVAGRQDYSPGLFFASGFLLLLEGIFITGAVLDRIKRKTLQDRMDINTIARANIARNPKRSLAVMGILSAGIFIVISVSSNSKMISPDVSDRASGTGGFNLFCKTALPLRGDLDSPEERKTVGLKDDIYRDTVFAAMRLREGDDASCLNPGTANLPGILGVDPQLFSERDSFVFKNVMSSYGAVKSGRDVWPLLDSRLENGNIPAFADMSVIQWGLGKKLGDYIEVVSDSGRTKRLELIAGFDDSIFQGYVIISESNFLENFASSGGFNVILVDCGSKDRESISADLSRALSGYGIEISDTAEKLAEFNAVQNTYISIFLVLGVLGLVLGTAGLGTLILKNILERKGEMALMRAVGFPKKLIIRTLIPEYTFMLFFGVVVGTVAAGLAVMPVLIKSIQGVPYLLLAAALALMISSGWISIYFAGRYSIKGNLIDGLREE